MTPHLFRRAGVGLKAAVWEANEGGEGVVGPWNDATDTKSRRRRPVNVAALQRRVRCTAAGRILLAG